MLLVLREIANVSADSVVMVSGPKLNWFDLSAIMEKDGIGAFGDMGFGPPECPQFSSRFLVLPLMTDDQRQKSPAVARAAELFGPVNDVWSPTWPAGDTTFHYPPMKAGVAATSGEWGDQGPPPPGPDVGSWSDGIFLWIVPPPPAQVSVTRIEVISYDSVATTAPAGVPSLWVAQDTYLVSPNVRVDPSNNPVKKISLRFSTWVLPNTLTQIPVSRLDWNDPWNAFLSNVSIAPVVAPSALGTPATQTIQLPDGINSHQRDFIDLGTSGWQVSIPASPMVFFDISVGDKVLPSYVGMLDYSRAEVIYDNAQLQKIADSFTKLAKEFAWAFDALMGVVEWDDPALGLLVNLFIDVENPPSD